MVTNFTCWHGLAKSLFPPGAIQRLDGGEDRDKGIDPAGVAGFCFAMMGLILAILALEHLIERLF